jgi:hypothetical protein
MTPRQQERRTDRERRIAERRRTMRYHLRNLLIIDGITWIDPEGDERRRSIRRRVDRESAAIKFVQHAL